MSLKNYDCQYDFISNASSLKWKDPPKIFTYSLHGLTVIMDGKTDYWRQTYYNPVLIKNNGHLLYHEVLKDDKVVVETEFTLNAVNEFDQAGLMLYFNEQHWIKCGLEFCDEKFGLSCVNTNNYSDWSTNNYPSKELALRIYKLNEDIVIEAKIDHVWKFIRICHLSHQNCNDTAKIGLYCCSPTDKGGDVNFKYLKLKSVDGYSHKN